MTGTTSPSSADRKLTDVCAEYGPFLERLAAVLSEDNAGPCRVFHGRGHAYPGLEHLNVDWYPPVLLLSFHQEPERPEALVQPILAVDTRQQIRSLVLQHRRRQGARASVLWGEEPGARVVTEGSLEFEVWPGKNRNAGLFLDTRPLRDWLQLHSAGRNVLNLFAYTCSFSVAAVAGGARRVTNVDMSRPGIAWGMRNHRLNGQDLTRVTMLPHNIFTSWGRIRQLGRYDLVIVDPPTRQAGSFDVEKNYRTVIRRLPGLVNAGADIIATVNSPYLDQEFLVRQFAHFAPELTFVERLSPAAEFIEKYPERSLKIYRFRMNPAQSLSV